MRLIKFRAWDINKEIMVTGPMAHITLDGEIGVTSQDAGHPCDLELMQFTGLTDRNGREIYEGDILTRYENNPLIFKVVFVDGRFCEWWNGMDEATGADGSIMRHNAKVIGNIHEHGDLLK